ncbi:uncharacterized protein LOC132270010 [Cornus florida]|uniref:uncharacterized protein LOC132270010 n=1 Tax=Cornus florida TaxID=4283 RepID=UPI0028A0772B|nr:uncharacterized protein LOC132270010 [Cornus florida]
MGYSEGVDDVVDDDDLDDGAGVVGSNINMLTDDIMMQILGRFPPETLIKYKGVSSSWRRLIIELCNHQLIPKDGYPFSGFIFSMGGFLGYPTPRGIWYCHGRSSSQQKLLGAEDQSQTVAQSFLASLPSPSSPHDDRELLDCCNGLLLFRHSNLYKTPKYIVCNPTTSEYVEILGNAFDPPEAIGAFAFNPCESHHYKVVLIPKRRGCRAHLKIFSSEIGRQGSGLNPSHIMRILINRQVSKTDQVQSIDLPLARLVLGSFRRECIGLQNGHILQYALYNGKDLLIFTLEHTSGNIYGSLNKDDFYWSLKHNVTVRTTNNFLQPTVQNPFMWFEIYAFYPDSNVIVMGYRKLNSRFSVYCYNYKLQRIEEHTKMVNFNVTGDDNLSVLPFARCFLSLPKCRSEFALADSKMCDVV